MVYYPIEYQLVNRTCETGYLPSVAGFIDYYYLTFCLTSPAIISPFLVLWLLFLTYVLVTTTHLYFGKAVSKLSEKLRLSSHIFGVTFMAISYVSGDFFITTAAVYHQANNIVIGGILGSVLFTLTITTAITLFLKREMSMPPIARRPFFRDMFFIVASTLITGFFWLRDHIHLWQSILMVGIYLFYLVIVSFGRYLYQKKKLQQREGIGIIENADESLFELANDHDHDRMLFFANVRENSNTSIQGSYDAQLAFHLGPDQEVDENFCKTHAEDFIHSLVYDGQDWSEKDLKRKFFTLITAPSIIARNLTIPTGVGISWSKPLILINCFLCPLFILVATEYTWVSIPMGSINFPLWGLILIISFVVAVVIFFTSTLSEPPIYFPVLVFFNVVMSSAWLYLVGLEYVTLMLIVARITGLSEIVVGLIILGCANSLIAVMDLTKWVGQGFFSMALSGIWAVVPLKLMFCLGFSFMITLAISSDPQEGIQFLLESDVVGYNCILLTIIAILFVVLANSFWMPISKFKPSSKLGILLIVTYALFFLLVVLVETNVIGKDVFLPKQLLGIK